jgi:transposase InsO family protein
MTDPVEPQAVALFRYGLIAEFLHWPKNQPGLYQRLRQKASQDYQIPGSLRQRVAAETLRHWIKDYKRGGIDALAPKPRNDLGRSRALPQHLADQLLALKEEQPHLSVAQLIASVTSATTTAPASAPSSAAAPAASTLYRLLRRAGLMDKSAEHTSGLDADRRRFAFEHPGQLWMSDVMHGPSVTLAPSRTRRKAYLIAFLDDATRVVPYCAFALAESTQAFLPVFKQALMRRGIPQRLYVDNGANYRSQQLALVCAKLGIALIHARPYQPSGKGKQERFFRTVRSQLLPTLSDADTASLEALNRRLWAWVETEYHHHPHRGLDGDTPLQRWAAGRAPRLPEPDLDLDALFLFEAKRRVQRDHTVSLNGTAFELDAALVGQTVTLRYDPSAPAARGIEVWHEGRLVVCAKPVDAYANCFVRRRRPTQTIEPTEPTDPRAPAAAAPPPRASTLALRNLLAKPGLPPNPDATPDVNPDANPNDQEPR